MNISAWCTPSTSKNIYDCVLSVHYTVCSQLRSHSKHSLHGGLHQTRIVKPAATSSFPHFIESVIEMICHVMHGAFMLFIGWHCSAHTQCPGVPRERGQTHPRALRADRTDPRAVVEITVSVNTHSRVCAALNREEAFITRLTPDGHHRETQRNQTHTHSIGIGVCVCVCVCVRAHARRQKRFNQRVVSPHIHLIKLPSCSSKHPTILFAANKLWTAALVAIVL